MLIRVDTLFKWPFFSVTKCKFLHHLKTESERYASQNSKTSWYYQEAKFWHKCSGHLYQTENKFWLRSKFNVQVLPQDFRRFNGFSFCSCPNYLPKQLNARKSLLEFNIILAEFLMNKFSSRQRTYRKRIYQQEPPLVLELPQSCIHIILFNLPRNLNSVLNLSIMVKRTANNLLNPIHVIFYYLFKRTEAVLCYVENLLIIIMDLQ